MSEILDFMLRHWQLSGLFLLLIISYAIFELLQNSGGGSQISPEQAIDLYNHQDGVLLDIRASEAFHDAHIIGAMHVNVDEPDAKLKRFHKYAQKPVIIVSADGKNTGKFATRLAQQGVTNVLSLSGGINAWRSAGLPLTKK